MQFPNPLSVLKICFVKEVGALLVYAGILFAGLAAIATGLPSLFSSIYRFNDLQIGLACIPLGVGSCLAAITVGKLVDWNYRRHAARLGFVIDKARQQDLHDFPIEMARLEIALPLIVLVSATIIAYGWVLQSTQPLVAPLVLLFCIGFVGSGAFSVVSTLLVDVYPDSAGKVSAANNLVRCFLGAAASAVVGPMLRGMGKGGTYTFVGGILVAFCPLVLGVMRWGMVWKQEQRKRLRKAGGVNNEMKDLGKGQRNKGEATTHMGDQLPEEPL